MTKKTSTELKERIKISENALKLESNHPRLWNVILKNQIAIMKALEKSK